MAFKRIHAVSANELYRATSHWYCCVCISDTKELLPNPNSVFSKTCEDQTCSHRRCSNCARAPGA